MSATILYSTDKQKESSLIKFQGSKTTRPHIIPLASRIGPPRLLHRLSDPHMIPRYHSNTQYDSPTPRRKHRKHRGAKISLDLNRPSTNSDSSPLRRSHEQDVPCPFLASPAPRAHHPEREQLYAGSSGAVAIASAFIDDPQSPTELEVVRKERDDLRLKEKWWTAEKASLKARLAIAEAEKERLSATSQISDAVSDVEEAPSSDSTDDAQDTRAKKTSFDIRSTRSRWPWQLW